MIVEIFIWYAISNSTTNFNRSFSSEQDCCIERCKHFEWFFGCAVFYYMINVNFRSKVNEAVNEPLVKSIRFWLDFRWYDIMKIFALEIVT